jgi:hypothetical protein
MSRYLIRVIEKTEHLIVVTADDAPQALINAQLQLGEIFERTDAQVTYGKPQLLGEDE